MTISHSYRWLRQLTFAGLVLMVAAVGPLIFPIAESGYENLHLLAVEALLPALGAFVLLAVVGRAWEPEIARAMVWGALAGALATIALEAVRIPGFLLGGMPGNMPELMGVLLLNRFALGPSTASNIAGWAYHFWNGASFGMLYVLLVGCSRRWAALAFAIAVGVGFMLSPVVVALGVGYFGLQFSIWFLVTVLLAHIAFGLVLGWLTKLFLGAQSSPLWAALRSGMRLEMSRTAVRGES